MGEDVRRKINSPSWPLYFCAVHGIVANVLFSAIDLMYIWRFVCRITRGEGGRRGKDEAGWQEQRGEKEGREGK